MLHLIDHIQSRIPTTVDIQYQASRIRRGITQQKQHRLRDFICRPNARDDRGHSIQRALNITSLVKQRRLDTPTAARQQHPRRQSGQSTYGAIALTLILCGATSKAAVFVKPATACLEAM